MSYQDENSPKPETKSFVAGINNAFFDFSQDFNQKYHSHHLIDFPEINSLFSDKTLEFSYSLDNESMKLDHNSINQIMPQEFKDEPDYQHIQSHLSFNSMGFDCKEKQTKSLNPHLRLDFSPEMKLGLKGNSRFFSFDPEEDGLNSYWGGKSNSMKINGFEEINGFSGMAQYENFQDLKVKDQNFNQTTFQMKKNEGLFEKESGNRSSRGLRVLSLKVKDIVCEKKETTYKEVAEALVQGLNIKENEMGKDEQNVKRRVYDALNVLIAADILKKKGKHVISHQNSNLIGKSIKINGRNDNSNFEEIKNKIKENIKNKTEKLQDIVDKTVGLKYLIDRNQKNQQIKSEDHNQSFSFPFILLENKDNEQKVKCISSKEKKDLVVYFKNQFGVYGDMDVLIKLGFHHKGHSLAKDVIEATGAKNFL